MIRTDYLRSGLLLMLAVVSLASLGTVNAADDESALRQKFIGEYELVSYIQFPPGGGEVDTNFIGRLSYDAFGNMSGLGMPRDLPQRNAQSSERITGGFAYWGKVSFNLENQTVIHHVEGSPMVPEWVGQDNVRYFEFTDEFLKLTVKNAEGRATGTLTWRKLK